MSTNNSKGKIDINRSQYPYCSIPPAPDLNNKMKAMNKMMLSGADMASANLGLPVGTFALIQSRSLRRPQHSFGTPARISPKGKVKAVVLLVDFEDDPSSTKKDHYSDLLFSSGTHSTGSMRDYFKEVSDNKLDVEGDVYGWYRLPQKYSYYTANNFGDGDYPHNAKRLVEDAVKAADADVNFADYDSDGDGIVDAIFVVHAGQGAEETGDKGAIWSHRWALDNPVSVDGVSVLDYTIEAENGRIGLFCHEFVHVFNIPDLYDTGYDSAGIGDWCLMASGSWGGAPAGSRPVHPCAWVKKTLGWVKDTNSTGDQTAMSLAPVETEHEIVRLWTNGNQSKEYFLLENRQKSNFDASLPGEGLLIYHIDETMTTNSDQNHPLVGIEQADGKRDLQNNNNQGDNGDPYVGQSNNKNFDTNSNPNSKSYTGKKTSVSVSNINNSSNQITFDLKVQT